MTCKTPIHIRAVDWALESGFCMSVTDLCADDGEWDCEHSTDRADILECINGTDVPNVYIYRVDGAGRHEHITTFSVIDEGEPSETINDYTCGPRAKPFDDWFDKACEDYY